MNEIDVALSDYVLWLESTIFAILIAKKKELLIPKMSYLITFIGFALSAFIGGTYHGFFTHAESIGPIIWWLTLIAVGITAYGFALNGVFLLAQKNQKLWKTILIQLLIVYCFITLIKPIFLMAILCYVPATLFNLAGFIKAQRSYGGHKIEIGVLGLILSLIAPVFQQLKIDLHPVYFTHNTLYHIILMVALYLFFVGANGVLNISDQENSHVT